MHRQSHQVRSGKRSPYYAMKLVRWLLGMREPTPMNIQLSELDRNWAAHFDPEVQHLAALVGNIIQYSPGHPQSLRKMIERKQPRSI